MGRRFRNDWLQGVIGRGRECELSARPSEAGFEPLLKALYSLRPRDIPELVKPIQEFEGTKVMVACSDRTSLEEVVKQALCLADLVILVPSPLWVSCDHPRSIRYSEFNLESVTLAGCFSVSMRVLNKVARLMVNESELFDDGSVTFLPVLGDTLHRWSNVDLSLPEFPKPYSEKRTEYSTSDVHLEALYGLLSERVVAERLGAVHMNVASFETAILGDFVLARPDHSGRLKRSLVDIVLPDPGCLPFSSIRLIRDEVPTMTSVLGPKNVRGAEGTAIEDLLAAARDWTRQFEAAFASAGRRGGQMAVVVGSSGPEGSAMTAADFLLSGGSLDELARMITHDGAVRLEIRQDSMLAALTKA